MDELLCLLSEEGPSGTERHVQVRKWEQKKKKQKDPGSDWTVEWLRFLSGPPAAFIRNRKLLVEPSPPPLTQPSDADDGLMSMSPW